MLNHVIESFFMVIWALSLLRVYMGAPWRKAPLWLGYYSIYVIINFLLFIDNGRFRGSFGSYINKIYIYDSYLMEQPRARPFYRSNGLRSQSVQTTIPLIARLCLEVLTVHGTEL